MSKYGFEFTGQEFINERGMVACPTCGKAISASGTGWFDSYVEKSFAGTQLQNGAYVCMEHLSDERKKEILVDSPKCDFSVEKDWVNKEQVEGPTEGPLVKLLNIVAKSRHDPELSVLVDKVFKHA